MSRFVIVPGDVRFNLGDTAICLGTIALLRRLDPLASISVWGKRPLFAGGFEGIPFFETTGPAVLAEARRSDAVLWGGGQLLQSNRSRVKLPYQAARIGALRLAGARVVGFAQGVGPLPRRADRWLAGWIARRTAAFTVRDRTSFRCLEDAGVPRALLRLAADPALVLDPPPPTPQRAERPVVGISLRWTGHHRAGRIVPFQLLPSFARRRALADPAYARFRESAVELANRIVDELDVDLVVVPMYHAPWETDERLARAVAQGARRPDRVRVFRPRRAVSELTTMLRGLHAFVGTPMHATILATSQGVPTLALPYEPKGHDYMHRLGQGEWAVCGRGLGDPGDASAILDRVRSLWRARERIHADLADRLPKLRKRAEASIEPLRELLGAPSPVGPASRVEKEVV